MSIRNFLRSVLSLSGSADSRRRRSARCGSLPIEALEQRLNLSSVAIVSGELRYTGSAAANVLTIDYNAGADEYTFTDSESINGGGNSFTISGATATTRLFINPGNGGGDIITINGVAPNSEGLSTANTTGAQTVIVNGDLLNVGGFVQLRAENVVLNANISTANQPVQFDADVEVGADVTVNSGASTISLLRMVDSPTTADLTLTASSVTANVQPIGSSDALGVFTVNAAGNASFGTSSIGVPISASAINVSAGVTATFSGDLISGNGGISVTAPTTTIIRNGPRSISSANANISFSGELRTGAGVAADPVISAGTGTVSIGTDLNFSGRAVDVTADAIIVGRAVAGASIELVAGASISADSFTASAGNILLDVTAGTISFDDAVLTSASIRATGNIEVISLGLSRTGAAKTLAVETPGGVTFNSPVSAFGDARFGAASGGAATLVTLNGPVSVLGRIDVESTDIEVGANMTAGASVFLEGATAISADATIASGGGVSDRVEFLGNIDAGAPGVDLTLDSGAGLIQALGGSDIGSATPFASVRFSSNATILDDVFAGDVFFEGGTVSFNGTVTGNGTATFSARVPGEGVYLYNAPTPLPGPGVRLGLSNFSSLSGFSALQFGEAGNSLVEIVNDFNPATSLNLGINSIFTGQIVNLGETINLGAAFDVRLNATTLNINNRSAVIGTGTVTISPEIAAGSTTVNNRFVGRGTSLPNIEIDTRGGSVNIVNEFGNFAAISTINGGTVSFSDPATAVTSLGAFTSNAVTTNVAGGIFANGVINVNGALSLTGDTLLFSRAGAAINVNGNVVGNGFALRARGASATPASAINFGGSILGLSLIDISLVTDVAFGGDVSVTTAGGDLSVRTLGNLSLGGDIEVDDRINLVFATADLALDDRTVDTLANTQIILTGNLIGNGTLFLDLLPGQYIRNGNNGTVIVIVGPAVAP